MARRWTLGLSFDVASDKHRRCSSFDVGWFMFTGLIQLNDSLSDGYMY